MPPHVTVGFGRALGIPVRSILDMFADMQQAPPLEHLARSIEDFTAVFIRIPVVDRLSFSSLSVLHTLSRAGSCRLSDLVRTEQIKQPALTAAVAKLERDGLVRRSPDPRDGRASMLSLTAAGQAIVSRRHAARVAGLRRLLDRLPSADRERLLGIADVFDQIVELAAELDHDPAEGSAA
jgi:DNA-binding MarR family transcriptional regulator